MDFDVLTKQANAPTWNPPASKWWKFREQPNSIQRKTYKHEKNKYDLLFCQIKKQTKNKNWIE